MVTDSLRYWVTEMHVDGFRFDLGTILARQHDGFDDGHGFLQSCLQDPVLSSVKLIAEPWDIGPGGYQVGGFPPGWAEWNDKFRDTVRAFWKGDEGKLAETGDAAGRLGRCIRPPRTQAVVQRQLHHRARRLHAAAISSRTTTSTTRRTARTTRTAIRTIMSWNHGVEGPTDDPEIIALRNRQKRNLLATLLLAQGTPMLLAGDEFGRTQQGNNNAYAQDNAISWVDWNIDEDGARADRVRPQGDRVAPRLPDPAPLALPDRRIQRRSRREGCALADAGGDRHRSPSSGRMRTRAASAC